MCSSLKISAGKENDKTKNLNKIDLLHGFGLGSRSYSGYRQTDVNGGSDT